MIWDYQHEGNLTKMRLTKTEPVCYQVREPYRHKSFHTACLCSSIAEGVFKITSLNFPLAHSNCHCPGLPLRAFSNSTCQRAKPTPGVPSIVSLCTGWICHRHTQAVVVSCFGR